MEVVNGKMLKELDQYSSLKGAFKGSRGLSRRLLIFWDSSAFNLLNCDINEYWICVSLKSMLSNQKFVVVTVYSPQSLRDKKSLWESLSQIISHNHSENLPVLFIGNFNCTRSTGDKSNNGVFHRASRIAFNNWV